MTDSPTIIKAKTTADLLAMLPQLAGGPLPPGIAIASFAGRRTPSVLRHPLPRTVRTPELQAIAASLLGMISKLGGCDAVAIVVYTDEPFDVALSKYTELEQILLRRFVTAGFGVKGTFCVAADGWTCFDERDRHDLSEIDDSPLNKECTQRPETGHPLDGSLPRTDPALAVRVNLALDELDLGFRVDSFGGAHPYSLPDPIAVLESALQREPDMIGPESLAELILCHQHEGDFDRTITQICLGPDRAAEVWANTLAIREQAASLGEQPIELMLRERRRRGGQGNDEVGDLLTGLDGPAPDEERVRRAHAVLSHAVAHAPTSDRPTLLCALAWLHWAMGRGTGAGKLLEAASRADPGHELTRIIRHVTLAVAVPHWLLDRDLRELTDDTGPGTATNRVSRRRRSRARTRTT